MPGSRIAIACARHDERVPVLRVCAENSCRFARRYRFTPPECGAKNKVTSTICIVSSPRLIRDAVAARDRAVD